MSCSFWWALPGPLLTLTPCLWLWKCARAARWAFTGLYYTFSMTAQIMTPNVAGWLLENVGYKTLFPYASLFVFFSFVTMGFVRHGDNKVEAKKGLEAFDIED